MNLSSSIPDLCRAVAQKNGFLRGFLKTAFANGGYYLINRASPPILPREETWRACYIDVSGLVKNDMGTGIQRVARNLTRALNELLQNEAKVIPIWADIGTRGYFQARMDYTGNRLIFHKTFEPLRPRKGDIFLGADHSAMISLAQSSYLAELKAKGVELNFICHDILPVINPEWFMPGDGAVEKAWLKKFAPISRMICVSNAVKNELGTWLEEKRIKPCKALVWVHNGFDKNDFEEKNPISAIRVPNGKYTLVVGTIEPRKGHDQTLSAFEQLWKEGSELKLVFAGRQGWKMASFCERLRFHPESRKHFFWFDDCTDGDLGILYKNCFLTIVPSRGEGFGLPVLEAIAHGKDVICRDIPVFRELLGENSIYFSGDEPEKIKKVINKMYNKCFENKIMAKIQGWEQSANKIWTICKNLQTYN